MCQWSFRRDLRSGFELIDWAGNRVPLSNRLYRESLGLELLQSCRQRRDSTDMHWVDGRLTSCLMGVSRRASVAVTLIERVAHSRYNPCLS